MYVVGYHVVERALKERHLKGQSVRAVIYADIRGMRSVGPIPEVLVFRCRTYSAHLIMHLPNNSPYGLPSLGVGLFSPRSIELFAKLTKLCKFFAEAHQAKTCHRNHIISIETHQFPKVFYFFVFVSPNSNTKDFNKGDLHLNTVCGHILQICNIKCTISQYSFVLLHTCKKCCMV